MARPGTLPRHDLDLDSHLDDDDDAVPHPHGKVTLVEGTSYAPFDLAAAGFRSLRPLIGCGKVSYRGIRDDHHVFAHATGDRYEPVWRLRPPGPRGPFPTTPLLLGCGGLLATFTDDDHVWVSTPPVGLTVGASRVSFSFHHHRASDGRWIPSAWDAAHVRPVGGFLTIAPLGSLRDIEQVILPAIAAGLASLAGPAAADGDARPATGGPGDDLVGREPGQNPRLGWLWAICLWVITVILVLPLAALFSSLILLVLFELIILVDLPPHSFVVGGGVLVLLAGFAGRGRVVALSRRMARSQRTHGWLRPSRRRGAGAFSARWPERLRWRNRLVSTGRIQP